MAIAQLVLNVTEPVPHDMLYGKKENTIAKLILRNHCGVILEQALSCEKQNTVLSTF
jgi:hypothetical protein